MLHKFFSLKGIKKKKKVLIKINHTKAFEIICMERYSFLVCFCLSVYKERLAPIQIFTDASV